MSKHTPGPWVVFDDHPDKACFHIREDNCFDEIATIYRYQCNPRNTLADARLIAAAPDLLEALEELVDLFGGLVSGEYPPDGFTTQPARDAIAKARGESNE